MVKSAFAEESRLKLIEDRLFQSAIPAEVGLVIGKLNSSLDKGFVFELVPTPPNDNGEPACSISETAKDDRKKGAKARNQGDSSLLAIDRDWVAEHARQVSRLLLGGIHVIGIYIWASDSSFKNSNAILWQTAKVVADAEPSNESNSHERLLIHISFSPRRWACRNCTFSSSFSSTSLRPCDFKMGKLLPSLQSFRCMYNFEIRLPIFNNDDWKARPFGDVLRNAIALHARELKGAKALVNGNLDVEDLPSTSDTLQVEILLPFKNEATRETHSTDEVVGMVALSGRVFSSAYLCPKEPIAQVISDIKVDIINSLKTRLDIMCDAVEGNSDLKVDHQMSLDSSLCSEKPTHEQALNEIRKPSALFFPRRILVPWLHGVFICDYLQHSESFQDLKDHLKELLSMDPPSDASEIIEPEEEPTSLTTTNSFWDYAHDKSKTVSDCSQLKHEEENSSMEGGRRELARPSFSLATAVIVILPILIGLLLVFFRSF